MNIDPDCLYRLIVVLRNQVHVFSFPNNPGRLLVDLLIVTLIVDLDCLYRLIVMLWNYVHVFSFRNNPWRLLVDLMNIDLDCWPWLMTLIVDLDCWPWLFIQTDRGAEESGAHLLLPEQPSETLSWFNEDWPWLLTLIFDLDCLYRLIVVLRNQVQVFSFPNNSRGLLVDLMNIDLDCWPWLFIQTDRGAEE